MNKLKNFVKTVWKWTKIVAVTAFLVACVAGSAYIYFAEDEIVSEPVVTHTEEVEEVIEDVDTLAEARKQLEEATKALDDEEARLMAEIEEREARIEEINSIRASF